MTEVDLTPGEVLIRRMSNTCTHSAFERVLPCKPYIAHLCSTTSPIPGSTFCVDHESEGMVIHVSVAREQ